ncbi:MAG: hypothetical protein HZA93_29240 [Verrucomicrobia bacterium]|nr:hypothetical protein [Verrucomicrobiota bacterium]
MLLGIPVARVLEVFPSEGMTPRQLHAALDRCGFEWNAFQFGTLICDGFYLDQRDDDADAAAKQAKRDGKPARESPDGMVSELLADIGRRFYQGRRPPQKWLQDQKPLMMTLTWPAGWLKTRGVSLSVARYREILREIVTGIATHGDLAKIEYFPSYLQHCVRLWFVHNGEELYYRQKGIRDALDLGILKGGAPKAPVGPDPMDALAAAHRVLASQKRAAKTRKEDSGQTTFF